MLLDVSAKLLDKRASITLDVCLAVFDRDGEWEMWEESVLSSGSNFIDINQEVGI
ncbi:hypothetical protein X548_02925 [Stenotrophomonas maltophilia 5BA-I-2]|nr:hypothetical protein X548_02925 [Stenotrophomonas maltophilia 5BA-I-2]